MRLRVRFTYGILATTLLTALVFFVQRKHSAPPPTTKPADYVLERLARLTNKNLPDDFFGNRFDKPLDNTTFSELMMQYVQYTSDCVWQLHFWRSFSSGGRRIHVALMLNDAELGGVVPSGAKVEVRMLKPASVLTKYIEWRDGNQSDSIEMTGC
jgi:hypothetical protein